MLIEWLRLAPTDFQEAPMEGDVLLFYQLVTQNQTVSWGPVRASFFRFSFFVFPISISLSFSFLFFMHSPLNLMH
jgi:hypothetical protein